MTFGVLVDLRGKKCDLESAGTTLLRAAIYKGLRWSSMGNDPCRAQASGGPIVVVLN